MLIDMGTIMRDAANKGYGVAVPSTFDGESIRSCFEAAYELRSPMVINAGWNLDIEYIANVTKFYSRKFPEVPVALNLDHGKNFTHAARAIRVGFTSVMIDRSTVSFEDNVKETSEVVKLAHSVGVSVEAELGHVGQGSNYSEDRFNSLTRPEDVIEFVKKTDVDCLAIAIGNAHGLYIGTPKLDFDRLDDIRKVTSIPLVLHGGSSTGDENLKKAIAHGITKINLGTDLGISGSNSVRKLLSIPNPKLRVGEVVKSGMEGYKNELIRYIRLFGGTNRW